MRKGMKRVVALAMAGVLGITGLPAFSQAETVFAQSPEEGLEAQAVVEEGTVAIGNGYISRSFDISGDQISTEVIQNKRAGLDFQPAAGSEEFIIRLRKGSLKAEDEIDRTNWEAWASDQHNDTPGASDGPAQNLIDGDESTIWHSQYEPDVPYPHTVVFDMKEEETVRALSYLPRQDGGENGDIGAYEIYVGNSREDLESSENLAASGIFSYDGREAIYINFPEAKTGRYVELKAVSPKTEGKVWAAGAEVRLYRQPVGGASDDWSLNLKASDLTLDQEGVRTENTENGVMAVFPFETYWKNGVNWDIAMKVVMDDGDHFMRKFLEIQVDDPQKACIDYIDLESLNVNESDVVWTHPQMGEGVGGMSGYVISLGQPVYIQGMFLGCEFPLTETEIDENSNAHMRYYSGKNFLQLEEDLQTTTDGKYVTWQTVVGAARSTDMNVIQSDFYDYIDQFAEETDFRTQYNSWYDNMMNISDENIESAFTRMEKGLSESGVIPMDSYVVDDGWNNYNTEKYGVYDESRSGTTYNETGFWEFNNKFPNGFTPASQLSKSFDSSFGVWLGPRGGYNYNDAMGHIIEDAGYGAHNDQSWDIDVGDRRYIAKMTEFLTQMQDAYKINYWKLDGFATQACTDSSHDHMTGGKNGMYYFTDAWEGWIDLFEALRANARKNGIEDLWLNLTCYVNPSPWHLQWANSIWIQNSQDMGRIDVGQSSQMDQLLSYRDGRYFDFVKEREFQFPLANLYNHDPIYGKEGTDLQNQMNDEEFQVYLYMMATRGTAFWELYYSPEMMDEGEKWAVNAEFLEWARENHHILKHAKLIGNTPDQGNTYGYSCWDGENGIISMRNPSGETKTLEFVLDRNIGVPEALEGQTLYATTLLAYKTAEETKGQTFSYGDKITVTLQPGEARIWSLSAQEDQTAPSVRFAKAKTNQEIEIVYDEKIRTENLKATVDGEIVQARRSADGRTLWLTTETPMTDGVKASITIENVEDLSGNSGTETLEVPYYEGGLAAKAYTASDLKDAADVSESAQQELEGRNAMELEGSYEMATENAISGSTDFAVSAYVNTESSKVSLIRQGEEYDLSLNEEGKLVFAVGGVSVTSEEAVNDGTWRHVAGIRERNGILKVYVDGKLDSSVYDEAQASGKYPRLRLP